MEKEALCVVIGLGIERDGVVDIPRDLLPRIEHNLFVGVVWVERRDDAFHGVIEKNRADADVNIRIPLMRIAEERLELADGLALVVEYRPAASDPARAEVFRGHHRLDIRVHNDLAVGIALGNRSRFSLNLLLDFAFKAVGVAKADLDFQPLCRQRLADVRLACQRGSKCGLAIGFETIQVVDDACSGLAEKFRGMIERLVEEVIDLLLGEISRELSVHQIALHWPGSFAHHGSPRNQTERIKGDCGTVAVGVRHEAGLEDTVVMLCHDRVAERVLCLGDQQVVSVIHETRVAEWIPESPWHEEMQLRFGLFL